MADPKTAWETYRDQRLATLNLTQEQLESAEIDFWAGYNANKEN